MPYSDPENCARAQADCMEAASRQAASTIDPKLLARVAKGDPQAFEQLYDVRALRVIVPQVRDCYTVLGIRRSTWRYGAKSPNTMSAVEARSPGW